MHESWWTGQPLEEPPTAPLTFVVDSAFDIAPASVYTGLIPLWSEAVVAAVKAAGGDNIDLYPALLRDEQTGVEWPGYWAVNVLGVVAAIDLDASGVRTPAEERGDLLLDQVVFDSARAAPFRLFRLAEALEVVVVDKDVRRSLELTGPPDVRFAVLGLPSGGGPLISANGVL